MGGLPAEAQCKQPLSQAKVQRHGTMYNGPFLSKFYLHSKGTFPKSLFNRSEQNPPAP
jgi:hypothetical protein